MTAGDRGTKRMCFVEDLQHLLATAVMNREPLARSPYLAPRVVVRSLPDPVLASEVSVRHKASLEKPFKCLRNGSAIVLSCRTAECLGEQFGACNEPFGSFRQIDVCDRLQNA